MPFTRSWDNTAPVDHSKFKDQPGSVRNLKVDIEDRLKNFFYGLISSETSEGVKKLSFKDQVTDPATVIDEIQLYGKAVTAKTELFIKDEDGNVQQVTRLGKLFLEALGLASQAQGDLAYFDGTKWTRKARGTASQFWRVNSAGTDAGYETFTLAYPKDYIYGLDLANNAIDPLNDIDLSIGEARDSANAQDMTLSSSLTKQLDAAFAAGTNAGGLFSGVKAVNTWYFFHLIRKDSDGTIDAGFDTSPTAANKPAGYGNYRRLGAIRTDATGNIRKFYQIGKGPQRKYIYDNYNSILDTVTPASVFTDIDCSAFIPSTSNWGVFNAQTLENNGAASSTIFKFRTNGSSAADGSVVCRMIDGHGSGGQGQGLTFEVATDSSQIIEYKLENQQIGIKLGVMGFIDEL